jgi:hypothetical protein
MRPKADPVDTYGPHLLKGDVLLQCGTIGSVVGAPASGASLSALSVTGHGGFWGTSFVKNPTYSEQPVEGVFEVEPSGKVEAWLTFPSTPGVTDHGRGMLFDGGKHGFLIMPLETTQPDGSIVRPAFARCELLSLGR